MAKRPTKSEIAKQIFPNAPSRQQIISFYAQLGQAIASWTMVELGLFEILRALVFSPRPFTLMAAFNSTTAFRTKLMMVDAAAQALFHQNEGLRAEWNALRNRAKKLSDHRNAMAHFPVWIEFLEERPERRVYQSPDILDVLHAMRKRQGDEEPYTLARLKDYTAKFRALSDELAAFAHKVPEPPARP